MRTYILLAAVVLCLSLSSCQCSDPPPVGEVASEEAADTTQQGASDRR